MSSKHTRNIPLAKPVFDAEMEAAAINALRNERHVMGEDVCKFEEEFARYIGTKYAVSTSSGTNALQIALLTMGMAKRDEVITSAYSFIASGNVVLQAGATPVFADIDSRTFNVDPKELNCKVTKNTKALLPVHLYGYPCNMKEIMEISEEGGFMVVEDACQAHGAEYAGRKVGAIGHVGCFSFYPSKNMTVCGDGGMIVTDDEDLAKLSAKLRDCGRKSQYEHDVIGYTSRLNTVNAAIGRVQLRRLDEWNKRRVEIAALYDNLLADIPEVVCPLGGGSRVKPVYHVYAIRAETRDMLREHLKDSGVATGVHYPLPIPLQPIYKQMFGCKNAHFPESEKASLTCLSLPIYPALGEDEVHFVCERIREFYELN